MDEKVLEQFIDFIVNKLSQSGKLRLLAFLETMDKEYFEVPEEMEGCVR